jgi:hypothetical protein
MVYGYVCGKVSIKYSLDQIQIDTPSHATGCYYSGSVKFVLHNMAISTCFQRNNVIGIDYVCWPSNLLY